MSNQTQVLPPVQEAHLAHLASLEDGWADGEGYAPAPECLDTAREFLTTVGLPLPADSWSLYPTMTGRVQLVHRFGARRHGVGVGGVRVTVELAADRTGIVRVVSFDQGRGRHDILPDCPAGSLAEVVALLEQHLPTR